MARWKPAATTQERRQRKSAKLTKELITSKIEVNARGCWVWQGQVTNHGHGYHGQWGNSVHREAYKLWKGEVPKGLHLDHRCRNKLCCNPDHLFPVSPGLNTWLAWIEKYKQMPWRWLRIARWLHDRVTETADLRMM